MAGGQLITADALDFVQERTTDGLRLHAWMDREHTDVDRGRRLERPGDRTHQKLSARREYDRGVATCDECADFVGVGALSAEQVRFGRPAVPASVPAVRALDQRYDRGDV